MGILYRGDHVGLFYNIGSFLPGGLVVGRGGRSREGEKEERGGGVYVLRGRAQS